MRPAPKMIPTENNTACYLKKLIRSKLGLVRAIKYDTTGNNTPIARKVFADARLLISTIGFSFWSLSAPSVK